MLAKTEKASVATSVDNWLAQFERALAEPDDVLLKTLFHADSHWRDVLALTWHIQNGQRLGRHRERAARRMSAARDRPVSGSTPIGLRPAT